MTAKVTTAARPAAAAKPAASKSTTTRAKTSGKAGKAASSKTSAKTTKTTTTKKKTTTAAPAKKSLAVGDWLPVCAFEAIAQSLRLAGQFVHDDDVAGLWDLMGADPLGATVAAALDAASEHGLAGCRPQRERLERLGPVRLADEFGLPRFDDPALPPDPFEDFLAGDAHGLIVGPGRESSRSAAAVLCPARSGRTTARSHAGHGPHAAPSGRRRGSGAAAFLILGVDVPGPHAVLATADGWWSWGELHSPWPCLVDQAWAVSWS